MPNTSHIRSPNGLASQSNPTPPHYSIEAWLTRLNYAVLPDSSIRAILWERERELIVQATTLTWIQRRVEERWRLPILRWVSFICCLWTAELVGHCGNRFHITESSTIPAAGTLMLCAELEQQKELGLVFGKAENCGLAAAKSTVYLGGFLLEPKLANNESCAQG